MTEYYHIVPWFNSEEWNNVYEKLYSPTSTFQDKQEALNLLLVWKVRCPALPSGVESTMTLLQVHVQDKRNTDGVLNEQLLRLAYSSAIMRFVNHMLDTETAKGTSLYYAAKNLGVPDWIIDMRHDTAHNNILPSLEILREAASISLNWLKTYYWDKHKLCIGDYLAGQQPLSTNEENKINVLMNFCIALSICAHSKCKMKNLSDIPQPSMRESIVKDATDLFGNTIDFSNLKTVSILNLINIMNAQSKRLLRCKDVSVHVNKALLSKDGLFLSQELINLIAEKQFYKRKALSQHYVQCFEGLLTFLHTNELLLDFLQELINISQNDTDSKRSLLAALWVSQILAALRKSKQFIEKMMKFENQLEDNKRKQQKALFYHWFPSENVNGLLLDLVKPVPMELTNINYIKPIISSYNANLTYFVRDLLILVEPHLPKQTVDTICKLAKSLSAPENMPSSKVFTVEDLKKTEESQVMDDSDVEFTCNETQEDETQNMENKLEDSKSSSIWKLASKQHDWATCPIGLLPWQLPKKD